MGRLANQSWKDGLRPRLLIGFDAGICRGGCVPSACWMKTLFWSLAVVSVFRKRMSASVVFDIAEAV